MSQINKAIETKSRLVVIQGWGRGSRKLLGMSAKEYGGFFGNNENVLQLIVVMDVQLWEYTKNIELYMLNG